MATFQFTLDEALRQSKLRRSGERLAQEREALGRAIGEVRAAARAYDADLADAERELAEKVQGGPGGTRPPG